MAKFDAPAGWGAGRLNGLSLFAVCVGAALGGGLRYVAGLWIVQPAWLPFAASTLLVNTVGGFCAGVLFQILGPDYLKSNVWGLFLMTGVLGGLTTFSAFTAEGYQLLINRPVAAALQAMVHVGLCLMCFALGHRLSA